MGGDGGRRRYRALSVIGRDADRGWDEDVGASLVLIRGTADPESDRVAR
jgi:hypothetical protein